MTINFFFGIPLRSRSSSKDWPRVCELFQSTLRSILGQTAKDFSVLVACHDVPTVPEIKDSRVKLLISSASIPSNLQEQMIDKHFKLRMIAVETKQRGGGYLMAVDGDDLVSDRIVTFVMSDLHPHGYIISRGYEFDYLTKRISKAPRFHMFCGSCGILYFEPYHLPDSANDPTETLSDRFIGEGSNHAQWPALTKALGRPLADLPFRGAMYVTNHGDNHSTQAGNVGWRRTMLRKFTPTRVPSTALRKEFGLNLEFGDVH